ncbi:MAG: Rab family GTPase [Promethearchaeia archaeon]
MYSPGKKFKKPIVLKILTLGEGGVGKTTLLHRYVEGRFIDGTKMTIGVEFFLKYLDIDNENYVLQIWDFGGQDQFRFILKPYAKGANGAVLLFDLTRPLTLHKIDEWVDIARSHDKDLPILFIGTKLDLEDEIMVHDDYAQELMKEYNLFEYIKVSSKTGYNVEAAFEKLAQEVVKHLKNKN